MKVLYLTTVYPGHKKTGGDIGSQRYADAMRRAGAEVDLVAYLRSGDPWPTQPWEHIAQERCIETAASGRSVVGWMLRSFLTGQPYSSAKYVSSAYAGTIKRLLAARRYDLIVLDHASRLLWLLPHLPPGVPVVANTHNVEHRLYERLRDGAGGGVKGALKRYVYAREARLVKRAEDALPTIAAEIWTVTAEDGRYFEGRGARVRAYQTPPGDFELPAVVPKKRFDVALIGNWSWTTNQEGLRWFAESIAPHIPSHISVEIAGKGADWLAGRFPNVRVRGFVPDAVEFVLEARVVAIPTQNGAGVQIKTLDSLATGVRMVATPFAVIGIPELPPTVQIAADPAEYLQRLIEAAQSPVQGPDPSALAWAEALRARYSATIAEALATLAAGA